VKWGWSRERVGGADTVVGGAGGGGGTRGGVGRGSWYGEREGGREGGGEGEVGGGERREKNFPS